MQICVMISPNRATIFKELATPIFPTSPIFPPFFEGVQHSILNQIYNDIPASARFYRCNKI